MDQELQQEIARLVGELQTMRVDVGKEIEGARGFTAEAKAEMVRVLAGIEARAAAPEPKPKYRMLSAADCKAVRALKLGDTHTIEVRAIVGLADVDALVADDRRPGYVGYDLRPIGFPSIVPAIPIIGNTYYSAFETELSGTLSGMHTTLDADADELEDFATLVSVAGLAIGSILRVYHPGGFVDREILAVDATTRVVTVDDAWGLDLFEGFDVRAHVLGTTPEGAFKPEMMAAFDGLSLELKTLAALQVMSEQAREVIANLDAWITDRLSRSAARSRAWGMLYGDGGTHVHGIFGAPGALTYAWSAGQFLDTMADAIVRAAALIVSDEQKYCVMNKLDWLLILLAKGLDGHYIHRDGNPIIVRGPNGAWTVDDVIIVEEAYIARGDFLIWSLGASERPYRGTQRLVFGYINDQFGRNQITARLDENTEHLVLSTQRFVLGEFDAPPADPAL